MGQVKVPGEKGLEFPYFEQIEIVGAYIDNNGYSLRIPSSNFQIKNGEPEWISYLVTGRLLDTNSRISVFASAIEVIRKTNGDLEIRGRFDGYPISSRFFENDISPYKNAIITAFAHSDVGFSFDSSKKIVSVSTTSCKILSVQISKPILK